MNQTTPTPPPASVHHVSGLYTPRKGAGVRIGVRSTMGERTSRRLKAGLETKSRVRRTGRGWMESVVAYCPAFTESSSMSKMSVELGPMSPPAPRSP